MKEQRGENEQAVDKQEENAYPRLDPNKLKDLFNKMAEIETDPDSEAAKEYYKKLKELEKKNPPKRKPGAIIIKNMRGGRTISTEKIEQNEDGTPLSNEEQELKKKFIDFAKTTFPEVNPIDLVLPDFKGNGQVRLQTYRYPCRSDRPRKGIVQLIHGLGDYCGRYAFLAKTLAENGYDVVGVDQRGYGFSEGRRALIESKEQARDDILEFSRRVDEKFGGADVPHFTIGHSLGGCLQLLAAAEDPDMYQGMTLIAPFISVSAQQKELFA